MRDRLPDDERKNFRGRSMGDRSEFSAPKSLAELKYGRNSENTDQQSLGKRKSYQQYEDDVPFEGPKPLSEILKEKKGVGAGAASSQSSKSAYNNKNEGITENGSLLKTNVEESKNQAADVVGREVDNTNVTHQSPEDGIIYDEAAEEQEYEGDDQGEEGGDYEYEQGDEEYEYEQVDEGENQEQEYMEEEEDGDDFAKKIGVVLS